MPSTRNLEMQALFGSCKKVHLRNTNGRRLYTVTELKADENEASGIVTLKDGTSDRWVFPYPSSIPYDIVANVLAFYSYDGTEVLCYYDFA